MTSIAVKTLTETIERLCEELIKMETSKELYKSMWLEATKKNEVQNG